MIIRANPNRLTPRARKKTSNALVERAFALVLGAICLLAFTASRPAWSAESLANSPACKQLQAKYPQFKGKILVDAVNPHTPGYEALDPQDPDKYIGFDIDLVQALGRMSRLQRDVQAGGLCRAADHPAKRTGGHRHLRHLRHEGACQGRRFHHLFESVRRRAGRQGQPQAPDRHQLLDVRRRGGGKHRLRRGAAACRTWPSRAKPAGKPAPTLQLYDNNADCIQAILAGRADTYVNDVNTVDQAVKAYPDKLSKAIAVTLPYSVGIAVPKGKPEFRDAILAALIEIQTTGGEAAMLKKWSLDSGTLEAPHLLTE